MDIFAVRFIILSLVYFLIGAILGLILLANPLGAVELRFIHSHLMLLGWVSMMIFGVGYHVLPRFLGKMLYSKKLGDLHFWLANLGLIGMLLFSLKESLTPLSVLFGILEGISILIFFFNMIKTVTAPVPSE